jgi:hypothetical protein
MTKIENVTPFNSVSEDPAMPKIKVWPYVSYATFEVDECGISGKAEYLGGMDTRVVIFYNDEQVADFTLHHQSSNEIMNEMIEIVSGLVWSRIRRSMVLPSLSEFASLRDTARALSERQSILVRERDEALSIIQHERKFSAGLTSDIEIERDQALQQVDEVSKVRDDLSVELTKAEAELTHLRVSGSGTRETLEKLFQQIVESKIGLDGVLQMIGRILGKEEP